MSKFAALDLVIFTSVLAALGVFLPSSKPEPWWLAAFMWAIGCLTGYLMRARDQAAASRKEPTNG